MDLSQLTLLIFLVLFYSLYADATKCKPLSKFKIDCDDCQCSEDGNQYSCTFRDCRKSSFLDADDGTGYVLGKPNKQRLFEKNVKDIDLDYNFDRNENEAFDNNLNSNKIIPFLNDEIPAYSKQFTDDSNDNFDFDSGSNSKYDTMKPIPYTKKLRLNNEDSGEVGNEFNDVDDKSFLSESFNNRDDNLELYNNEFSIENDDSDYTNINNKKQLRNVDLEEQNASVMDTGIPEEYRLKRSILTKNRKR